MKLLSWLWVFVLVLNCISLGVHIGTQGQAVIVPHLIFIFLSIFLIYLNEKKP